MKHILGLDLGTNSIGWAVVATDNEKSEHNLFMNAELLMAGSRILPMDADTINNYKKGNLKSQTSLRREFRSRRRMIERFKLRRERLNRVLAVLKFLPTHYAEALDRYGKPLREDETKIAWKADITGHHQFLFQQSFEEMAALFKSRHSDLKMIPYDWTLYYLRKKALTQEITGEELAWILHSFNQKRGYYQLRSDEEAMSTPKDEKYYALKVTRVEESGGKKGKYPIFNIHFENGMVYPYASKNTPDWLGKTKEFIVTTKVTSKGEKKYSFRMPKEEDWQLIKVRTEDNIKKSHKTAGAYIFDALLEKPAQKIRGKLVRTIDRHYYRAELQEIIKTQMQFHPELRDEELYKKCIASLYAHNEAYRNSIEKKGFVYLLIDDVLLYQRPLKTQKGRIADCPYEYHFGIKDGEKVRVGVKCIARSNPLFQEFRLWQFIYNLKIYQRLRIDNGKVSTDADVTDLYLTSEEDYTRLFDCLDARADINQKTLLKLLKLNDKEYRWNYAEEKTYPANETRALLLQGLKKANVPVSFLTKGREMQLWHLLYSINGKEELRKALATYATKNNLDKDAFTAAFVSARPFATDYGAYSEKAVKKLLALMRMGKYWDAENIDSTTRGQIDKLLTGEWDETISTRVREKAISLQKKEDFKGLPLWLACYVVYNRHSEAQEIVKWESPEAIDDFLSSLTQHSLRNPIVEQVVMETLRVVRDVWRKVGYIDEIHVEMGRDLKQTAEKRKQTALRIQENEWDNLRIKALLAEFQTSEFQSGKLQVDNVRPHSPSQEEALRLFEAYALRDKDNVPEFIRDILKKFRETEISKRPTSNDIQRYRLWLEQQYQSPYTGEMIPLGKLFTNQYQIEHIIPQARFFDNSYGNKVLCESEVNQLKTNMLGMEFIRKRGGEKVTCSNGKTVSVFSPEEYVSFVKEHYGSNPRKLRNLLSEDVPDGFTQRQLNDTRYISRFVLSTLSNIVREKDCDGNYEQEAISKNVIVCTGQITDSLKRDWGLNDVWNRILTPRFERMNRICSKEGLQFGYPDNKQGKRVFQIDMPLMFQRGFSKKRLDHRHHAMDAIVIACANRNIVNYLNNVAAHEPSEARMDLKRRLCHKVYPCGRGNYDWCIKKPWETFTQDVERQLRGIVVSFKQNNRVLTKTNNHYLKYNQELHQLTKVSQSEGNHLAVRKSLHKDTVFGWVNLRKTKEVRLSDALKAPERIVDKNLKKKALELMGLKSYTAKLVEKYFKQNAGLWKGLDIQKVKVYYFTNEHEKMAASRKPLDGTLTAKKLSSISDSGIRKILERHLERHGNDYTQAFSPDGIDEMNAHIKELNNGHSHQPIFRARFCETMGLKFPVGQSGTKGRKFVEADKGTNLYYAIYTDDDGKRSYETIPLNVVIANLKLCKRAVPETNDAGERLLFHLSPLDLVYVPTAEELETQHIDTSCIDTTRIYKMVSANKKQSFFIPYFVAKGIVETRELGSNNKSEVAWTGENIKKICVPVKINRIGEYEICGQYLPRHL